MTPNDIARMITEIDLPGYFDRQAESYDSAVNESFYTALSTRLCTAMSTRGVVPQVVLEIGCGTGFLTRVVTESFPSAAIHAVDPAADLLTRAITRVGGGVHWYNSRLAAYDGPNADTVLANMSFHWLDRDDLDRLIAVTDPGSVIGLTAPLRSTANHAHSGNELLYRAFRCLHGGHAENDVSKRWRGINAADVAIDGLLRVTDFAPMSIVEELSAEEFLLVLESRGVLLSLFGDGHREAHAWLRAGMVGSEQVQLSWQIGVFLAQRV